MFDRRVDGWVTIDPFGVRSLSLKSGHGETGATAPGDDDVYVALPDVLLRTVRRDLRLRLDRLQESPGTQSRCDSPVLTKSRRFSPAASSGVRSSVGLSSSVATGQPPRGAYPGLRSCATYEPSHCCHTLALQAAA